MVDDFGYTTKTSADVTTKTYTLPADIDKYTVLLLQCVKKPTQVNDTSIPNKSTTKPIFRS